MERFRIGSERKKYILAGLGGGIGDLLLHPGSVVFEKGDAITVPMQERIVNLVGDGLIVLFFRLYRDAARLRIGLQGWYRRRRSLGLAGDLQD